ncbi:MAG: thiopurine S-methyltransferase [Gammaproteobacteria bacterium]
MDHEFWLRKWASNEIGFHQAGVHPALARDWPALGCAPGTRVLVPLCGKSHDLRYLAAQGHEVVGIELSAIAVQDFFAESGAAPRVDETGGFERHALGRITLYRGDFFTASPAAVPPCEAWYDRAAFIALAPSQREAYVATLHGLLAPGARGLLVTVEYATEAVRPPPFGVSREEVARCFGNVATIRELAREVTDVKGVPGIEASYSLTWRGT